MIALFGASGFVGSHLTKILQDYYVINLRNTDWKNDIMSTTDVFINCVGKAHDHRNIATEQDFYHANVYLLKDVFTSFLESNAQLLIHISSIAAVEEKQRTEIITEISISNPLSFYGKSKRIGEEFLLEQLSKTNKKIIILRPSMIHGEGDKGNLKLLYNMILKGIPYPLGAYKNSRTFVSIDNLLFCISEIIKNKPKIKSGIYNIVDDEPLSTTEIIKLIGTVRNKKTHIIALPKWIINLVAKIGDVISLPINSKKLEKLTSTLLVSNDKIKKELNLQKLPLSATQGLEKTIKSFNN